MYLHKHHPHLLHTQLLLLPHPLPTCLPVLSSSNKTFWCPYLNCHLIFAPQSHCNCIQEWRGGVYVPTCTQYHLIITVSYGIKFCCVDIWTVTVRCKLKSLKIRRSLVAFHDNGQLVLVPHLMCGSALPLRFPLSALVVQATRQYLKFSSPFKWILDIHLCFVICLASFRVIVYSFDHCVVTKVTFSLIQIKGFT